MAAGLMLRSWSQRRRGTDDEIVLRKLRTIRRGSGEHDVTLGGYDLQRYTGMRARRLYPALWRLEAAGKVAATWNEPNDKGLRRRLYQLTGADDA